MAVAIFDAYRNVRGSIKYCKRYHKPLAEFTFRGNVYVIQRSSRVGWILWRGRERSASCKKTSFKICPCFFFHLSATAILVSEYRRLKKRKSPPTPEQELADGVKKHP